MLTLAEPALSRVFADAILAGWMGGANSVMASWQTPVADQTIIFQPPWFAQPPPPLLPPFDGTPPPEEPEGIRFPVIEIASRDLMQRRVLTRSDFDALDDVANRSAFTIARLGTEDAIARVREILARNIATGGSLRDFQRLVDEALGESALSKAHIENIYRTNVATAYTVGQNRVLSHPIVGSGFPYAFYTAAHDDRTRPEHLAMESRGIQGTNVYRRDDPTYQRFQTPWSYQCRCVWTAMTIRLAAERGIHEAIEWLSTGNPPEYPTWAEPPPWGAPPGFVVPSATGLLI